MLKSFINLVGSTTYVFHIWLTSCVFVLCGVVLGTPILIQFIDLSPFLLIIPLVALYFVNLFLMWILSPYEYLVTSSVGHFFVHLGQLILVLVIANIFSPLLLFVYAIGLYWYLDNYPTDMEISEVGVTNKVINGT